MRLRLIGWLVVAGTLDLAYPFEDGGETGVNHLIRGDNYFDNLRLRLFADVVINSRWTVFNQILIDPSSRDGREGVKGTFPAPTRRPQLVQKDERFNPTRG